MILGPGINSLGLSLAAGFLGRNQRLDGRTTLGSLRTWNEATPFGLPGLATKPKMQRLSRPEHGKTAFRVSAVPGAWCPNGLSLPAACAKMLLAQTFLLKPHGHPTKLQKGNMPANQACQGLPLFVVELANEVGLPLLQTCTPEVEFEKRIGAKSPYQ